MVAGSRPKRSVENVRERRPKRPRPKRDSNEHETL